MQLIIHCIWIISQSSKDRILSLGGNTIVLEILFCMKAARWLVCVEVIFFYRYCRVTSELWIRDGDKSQGFPGRDLFEWMCFCSGEKGTFLSIDLLFTFLFRYYMLHRLHPADASFLFGTSFGLSVSPYCISLLLYRFFSVVG